MRPGRLAAGTALAGLFVLATPAVALADPAGPTDYRSEVTAITPSTDVVEVTIEGGDAFVHIEVDAGHEVVVLGYDDEPYLRIGPDGVVEENRLSFATYYNTDRYGGEIPDHVDRAVDNAAQPDWERIGDGGAWSWHDHRAHWMGEEPPIGLEPGDSLPPQVVPIVVDGEHVEVEVVTTLQADPSPWPAIAGALLGVGIALAAWVLGQRVVPAAIGVVAAGALVTGSVGYWSLPPETAPRLTWWLLPLIAGVCSIAALSWRGSRLVADACAALAGLQLVLWAFQRRDSLTKAVLPTDLPFWLDRLLTATTLVAATGLLVISLIAMFRPLPGPAVEG